MRLKSGRSWHVLIISAAILGAATFSLVAQTPQEEAPVPTPSAQGGGAGAGQPAPDGTAPAGRGRAAGRGGGNRGGGPNLGGSQADDPAYAGVDFSKKDPVVPNTPAEEVKHLLLPPGFKMTPVLTDPDIQEPAEIAFDGNGRMFVLEIRGYMQDADATGEMNPVARISVHEDKDGDGVYETHHVFVDNLVFPRFVMPLGANAILTKESSADEVWKYTDTDGDGKADKKELFTTGMGRVANVEHQESGLFWAMDNWMYSTVNQVRIRLTPTGEVIRETTGSNGAQWGATQDNYGKPWFQSGASGMPGYFQFPIEYGNFTNPDQFEPNLNITWGAPVLIADMQGGLNSVRMPDGSLNRSTAGAGNDVYRGDRLPKDMIGDYFYGEAVARIVRRLHPVKTEGLTQLRNVYPLSEFIRSTDPLFRPIDMTTAPDGTMYITDIYRGIVQESQWSGPGTYLRSRINQYALDKDVRHGRIWRLSYQGMPRRVTQPHMLNETPAVLVTHLSDPNGWWRDMAQQLLVLKQDKSVVPALKAIVTTSPNQLARIHAMWTLEGLGSANAALLRAEMKDPDPQIRQAAIRVSESNYKSGDRSFAADWKNLTQDKDTDVVIQAMMTINTLKVADANTAITAVKASNQAKGVQLVANTILNPTANAGRGGGIGNNPVAALSADDQAIVDRGRQTYTEVCFACHGDDGRGTPKEGTATTMGPPLAGSPRVTGHRDYVTKVLLYGLTGPVNDTAYPEVMIPMGENKDQWVADIASYVRNSFGNRGPLVTAADVARVRAATAGRKTSWTLAELEGSLPKPLVYDTAWKLTASENNAMAASAVAINPWMSGKAQAPGMWLQVELPQAVSLTEVEFDSTVPAGATGVAGAPTRTGTGAGTVPASPPGFPRGYTVQVSMDGTTWGTPVATGQGTTARTDVTFAPTQAKFVRVTQTANTADAPNFVIGRLKLYEAGTAAAAK